MNDAGAGQPGELHCQERGRSTLQDRTSCRRNWESDSEAEMNMFACSRQLPVAYDRVPNSTQVQSHGGITSSEGC